MRARPSSPSRRTDLRRSSIASVSPEQYAQLAAVAEDVGVLRRSASAASTSPCAFGSSSCTKRGAHQERRHPPRREARAGSRPIAFVLAEEEHIPHLQRERRAVVHRSPPSPPYASTAAA